MSENRVERVAARAARAHAEERRAAEERSVRALKVLERLSGARRGEQ